MTFEAGFLMRPLGEIVLGAYADHHGRRAGLILTLTLMSVGIFSIACTPGYATIGLLAPLLVLIGRLLQGFSDRKSTRLNSSHMSTSYAVFCLKKKKTKKKKR